MKTNSRKDMRRLPKQLRSQKRVELILTVAERLFATRGFDTTTTNEIAKQANISIGSLYQFFPDKTAIMNALIESYLVSTSSAFEELLSREFLELSVPNMVDKIMDGLMYYYDYFATQRAVMYQAQLSPELWHLYEDLNDQMIDRMSENFKPVMPDFSKRKRTAIAYVCWYCTESLDKAFKYKSKSFTRDVDKELRIMLVNYLNHYLADN